MIVVYFDWILPNPSIHWFSCSPQGLTPWIFTARRRPEPVPAPMPPQTPEAQVPCWWDTGDMEMADGHIGSGVHTFQIASRCSIFMYYFYRFYSTLTFTELKASTGSTQKYRYRIPSLLQQGMSKCSHFHALEFIKIQRWTSLIVLEKTWQT